MIDTSHTSPYGVFVLRVTLGAFFFIHGAIKLLVFTPAGTARYFASLGLPPSLAYAIMTFELVGGIAMMVGLGANRRPCNDRGIDRHDRCDTRRQRLFVH